MSLIIDIHGHFTTEPKSHLTFRKEQLFSFKKLLEQPAYCKISDESIIEAIESNQLKIAKERGIDLTVFSPRASGMGHHDGDEQTSIAWTRHSNDLIARVIELFPRNFVGVCQLPQSPQVGLQSSISELKRCVNDLGFIGCNLNPDPSGGSWQGPPLTDAYWYPLFETMCELDVPAMIHVSGSCNPNFHTTGSHYLNADTTAFMQFLEGDLFRQFPTLRFVIPHGGGAVPYHWGRYRGLAMRMGKPEPASHILGNVSFDTCVYHLPGIQLLFDVIPLENILFASEMLGAVRGADPVTGIAWDDTKQYIDALHLRDADRARIFELNALRVYPRMNNHIANYGIRSEGT